MTAIAYVDAAGCRRTMMILPRGLQRISGGSFGVKEMTAEDCVRMIGRRLGDIPSTSRTGAPATTLYEFNGRRVRLLNVFIQERKLNSDGMVAVTMPRWVAELWEASCV